MECSLSFHTHINHLQYRNKASFTHSAKYTLVKMTIRNYDDVIYSLAPKKARCHLPHCHPLCYHFNTHHSDLYTLVNWPSLRTKRPKTYQFKSLMGKS